MAAQEKSTRIPKPAPFSAARGAGRFVRRFWPRYWRGRLALGLAGLVVAALTVLGSGVGLPVPQWALARIEARLNTAIAPSLPASTLAIDGITLSLGPSFAPRLQLRGVELRNLAGAPVMALPMAEADLAPLGLLQGRMHLRALRLTGGAVQVTRDVTGALDIAFAGGAPFSLAQVFAQTDGFFASPLGMGLGGVSVDGMSLALRDVQTGRVWALGDGALNITQEGGNVAADLALALMGQDGRKPSTGKVEISLIRAAGSARADVSMRVSGVSAQDLAAQAAPLAFMSVLEAPITGQLVTTLTPRGISALQASLDIGVGRLAPVAGQTAKPLAFQSAKLDLSYDPAQGRIVLNALNVISEALTLRANGFADVLRADGSVIAGALAGETPDAFAATLQVDSLRFHRPDLFTQEVAFTQGRAQVRLRLAPFSLTFEDVSLTDGPMTIAAKGAVDAQTAGWDSALELQVNQISSGKLLALWPKTLKPGTRNWLERNLLAGQFSDLRLTLRGAAGLPPDLDLRYQFSGLKVTPMRSLPPITDGHGYGAVTGRRFSMVLEKGRASPPEGGDLDMAGSVFTIPDIRVFPALGQLTLQSAGSLTATLSLIDQPPFRYMQKSGRAVDFAAGVARLTTQITLPLQKIITLPDITLQVTGEVAEFTSDQLAQGHVMRAPRLSVYVDKSGMRIAGMGDVSGAAFDAAYVQEFGPSNAAGRAKVTGTAALTNDILARFGVNLPDGMVTGQTSADIEIDLARGQVGKMRLTSDLVGMGLEIGPIGFAKARKEPGKLAAQITLSSPPQVTSLSIRAADLLAEGAVRLAKGGALESARFVGLTIGKWLAGDVTFLGQGAGKPPKMVLDQASVDLRFIPAKRGGSAGSEGSEGDEGGAGSGSALPLSLQLDRLRISDGITLRDFAGDFQADGGLAGDFTAQLEGGTALQGQLSPSRYGTRVRVQAQDAGAALAQAGVYGSVRGGALNLVLTPRKEEGTYVGAITMRDIRVQNANVLADLLNAISVVGLIDQLGGAGILFNDVTGSFILTPQGVDLREGAATGGSLGVSMQGIYQFEGKGLDMQGVISPIYVLNGIGAVISKRGEGVLGFNYRLRGTADAPRVSVNPLSLLLPGFLRNLFKPPKPKLEAPE
jgi:hypothetical protein